MPKDKFKLILLNAKYHAEHAGQVADYVLLSRSRLKWCADHIKNYAVFGGVALLGYYLHSCVIKGGKYGEPNWHWLLSAYVLYGVAFVGTVWNFLDAVYSISKLRSELDALELGAVSWCLGLICLGLIVICLPFLVAALLYKNFFDSSICT